MSTVPSMRPDSPRILSTPSLERQELLDELGDLDVEIESIARNAANALAALNATGHAGDINRERIREVVVELLKDETHDARTWIENRLEEID